MNATQSTHPSQEMLASFNSGRLGLLESAEIEQHLAACDTCCQALKSLPNDTLISLLGPQSPTKADSATGVSDMEAPPPKFALEATLPPGESKTQADWKPSNTIADILAELSEHSRYRILALLGRGGMGSVYQAEHRLMNRPVALKVIDRCLVQTPGLVERFHREVQAAAKLSHPNIVTAYDAEQAGNLHYLVMELVKGQDLSAVVGQRGPLPVHEACDYVRQAALGLQHASEHGMIHRDIKPHNLMLTPTGQVKILDFGLAQFASEFAEESGLTQAGSIMGTPDYMAPEQARDAHAVDIRADIYSLGYTLYCLLTGQAPFPRGSAVEKIIQHMESEPPSLASVRDDVPPELVNIVKKMTAKSPAERYQTPLEVVEALAPFARIGGAQDRTTQGAVLPTGRPPRSRRALIEAAAFGFLVLLAGVIVVTTDKGRIEIQSEVDDVEVSIKKGGKEIAVIDMQTGSQVKWFPSGKYDVELKGDDNNIEIVGGGFTLTRFGKAVVTLNRKPEADGMTEPFVVLDRKDQGKEYKFPTLAEAVGAALNGDSIEIRGNGPFVCPPIVVSGKALTIRAGVDYQPVLQLDPEGVKANANFLTTDAPLVLEGLELQRLWKSESAPTEAAGHNPGLVSAVNNLSAANCRFVQSEPLLDFLAIHCAGESCDLRNCIVLGTGTGLVRNAGPALTTSVDNCAFACSFTGMGVYEYENRMPAGSHHATRNTIVAGQPFGFFQFGAIPDLDKQAGTAPSIRWRSFENVLHATDFALAFEFFNQKPPEGKEALLRRLLAWEEQSNVYQVDMPLLGLVYFGQHNLADLGDWEQFWNLKNTGSVQGRIRYTGGDLWARMKANPESLVPADFRLHADSAGKGAGPGGKDLGVDVDLVGPGAAYERWKKTPEYESWLKHTSQEMVPKLTEADPPGS